MKVLVTGASGHIGNTLARQLAQRGHDVRAFVRRSSHLDGLQDEQAQTLPGIRLCYGDILDPASLEAAVAGCEQVFHTAAIFKTRLKDESTMLHTNMEGTRHIFAACAAAGSVKKLIYTSSVAAIGCSRTPDTLLDESSWNEDPIDTYVRSKADSERLAHRLADQYDIPTVYVNPGTVLGPYDHSLTPSNGFINLAMRRPSPVYFSGGHSYTDVEDVALGHVLAAEKGRPGERYILAGENVSMIDLFNKISRISGKRAPRIKIGHTFVSLAGFTAETIASVSGRPPLFTRAKAHKLIDYYGYFDSSKAARELGYRHRTLDEQLLRCQDWFAKHPQLGDI